MLGYVIDVGVCFKQTLSVLCLIGGPRCWIVGPEVGVLSLVLVRVVKPFVDDLPPRLGFGLSYLHTQLPGRGDGSDSTITTAFVQNMSNQCNNQWPHFYIQWINSMKEWWKEKFTQYETR